MGLAKIRVTMTTVLVFRSDNPEIIDVPSKI